MRRVADLVNVFRDPYHALPQLHRRDGGVSRVGAGPMQIVLLLGPEANKFIFANSELFSWHAAFEGLIPLAGEGALTVNDGDEHRRLRRLVQPAFTNRKVDNYLEIIRAHTDSVLDSCRSGSVVDLYGEFQRAIRRATVQVLFGARLAADTTALNRWLQLIHDAIDQNVVVRKLQPLGLPSWKKALAAREQVRRLVLAEITRRRAEDQGEASDVLGILLASRDEDGAALRDAEIMDQLISLLEAGAETTSAALGWTLYCVLNEQALWDKAKSAELGENGDYLDRVLSESLRLYPPAVIGPRKAAVDFDFAGHQVSTGTALMYSPYVTHRLAEVWPDPLRFDPDRWDPGRPGYRKPAPHEFLPFGGGPHRCVGAAFANMAVKAALRQVLRRAELRLESRDVRQTGLIGMRPRDGLRIRVLDVVPA